MAVLVKPLLVIAVVLIALMALVAILKLTVVLVIFGGLAFGLVWAINFVRAFARRVAMRAGEPATATSTTMLVR
jgi:hypothetical protein